MAPSAQSQGRFDTCQTSGRPLVPFWMTHCGAVRGGHAQEPYARGRSLRHRVGVFFLTPATRADSAPVLHYDNSPPQTTPPLSFGVFSTIV